MMGDETAKGDAGGGGGTEEGMVMSVFVAADAEE